MNRDKRILPIIILLLVLLIGGAGFLYGRLSSDYSPQQLQVQGGEQVPAAGVTPSPQTGATEEEKGEEESEETGESVQAPDFTVYDAEGNEVKLSDYFGKPIVLNFWASWCGPCQSEMPEFYEVWQERGEEISFVMINMTDGGRETRETASAWLAEQGYDFPVYYDVKQDAAASWGIYSLPTTCFLNGEGKLVAYAEGAIPKESLEMGISMITSGE